jgi:hypothetical protein
MVALIKIVVQLIWAGCIMSITWRQLEHDRMLAIDKP